MQSMHVNHGPWGELEVSSNQHGRLTFPSPILIIAQIDPQPEAQLAVMEYI